MRHLLSIIIVLCYSSAWAFPPGFIAVVTSGGEAESSGISDDFSSDTSANYTEIKNTVSIGSGVLTGGTVWQINYAHHEASLGSDNHFAQAKITAGGWASSGIIGVRCNGTTGYYFELQNSGSLQFFKFNGSTPTYIGHIATGQTITENTAYTVKVAVSGSEFSLYIDLNNDEDFVDTGEGPYATTDSTYPNGQYVVVGANLSNGGTFTVDNLLAGAL